MLFHKPETILDHNIHSRVTFGTGQPTAKVVQLSSGFQNSIQ